jgi:ElaB/YqjD/DUF883 family membrane-anchored ribosome-binding protein
MNTETALNTLNDTTHNGIGAGKNVVHKALDRFADGAADFRDKAAPVVDRWADQANQKARDSVQKLRDGVEYGRTQAVQASGRAVGYVRQEPVKSALIVAAAGVVIYALARLLRSNDR